MRRLKKCLTLFLAACLTVDTIQPTVVYATELGEVAKCEHHLEHTEECGYVEAVEGAECGHIHTDGCYTITKAEIENCLHNCDEDDACIKICTHQCTEDELKIALCVHDCSLDDSCIKEVCSHSCDMDDACIKTCNHQCTEEEMATGKCIHICDENCTFDLICGHTCTEECTDEVQCNHTCDEGCFTEGTCTHICNENCTLEVICSHVCDENCVLVEETGTKELNCTHLAHDEECRYKEAILGHECEYVCKICEVQELISQLPDEITEDNKSDVEAMLSEIDSKKLELSDAEMNLVDFTKYTEAIEKLTRLNSEPMIASNDMNIVYTSFVDSDAAVGDGSEQNPFNSFHKALDAVISGGQIIVIGKGLIEAEDGINQNGSDMLPYNINKSVTITGQNNAYLSVETAGIILGADVTFENIQIGLANPESNAIFANGHNLTLVNSGKTNSTRDVHLFTGGLNGSNASSGADGHIKINGVNTTFGNIYCGSMDAAWNTNSSVLIQNTSINEIGKIYGSGAAKGYYDSNAFLSGIEPEAPAADEITYPTNGDVNISLIEAGITEIAGAVRNGYKASVSVSTQYPKHNLSLEDIGTLCVESGELKPVTLNTDANLIVNGNAIADLSSIASGNEITLANLDARTGSIIRLNKDQKIKVTGDFVGEFELQSNDNISMSGTESGLVNTDTVYVEVLGNNGGTVNFNSASTQAGLTLVRDGKTWKTTGNSEVELEYKMISFGINESEIDREEDEVSSITVGVTYETSEDFEGCTGYLEWFPLRYEVTFNGNTYTTNSTYYEECGYYYGELPELGMTFYPLGKEDRSGEIEIELGNTLAVGNYTINVIVSAENTESGAIISDTFTVKVNGEQGGQPPVLSSDKSVTSVLVNGHIGVIDGQTITVELPAGEDLVTDNSLVDITVANTAIISNLTTADGGATWTFRVTAEDSSIAEYTINVIAHTHEYRTDTFEKDETNHWYECECGEIIDVKHHSFDNDCDIDCNDNCGYTRTAVHNYVTRNYDATNHWKECACGAKTSITVHTFDNACDEECNDNCGYTRTADHNYVIRNYDATKHWKECSCGDIANVGIHTSATAATCKDKAICKDCGTAYGELNSTNHTGGTEIRDKVDATTSMEGYTGDTYCLGCGTKIATGQTIPKKTTDSDNDENGGSGQPSGGQTGGSTSPTPVQPPSNPIPPTPVQPVPQPTPSTPKVEHSTPVQPPKVEVKAPAQTAGNKVEASTQTQNTEPIFEDYSIKRGDTLSKIAKRHGVTVEELINANKELIKNPNNIKIGWKLKIPVKGTEQITQVSTAIPFTPPDNRPTITYTIKRGDSLWKIANRNGVTVDDLIAFNIDTIKNPNRIVAGKALRIPKN